MNQPRGSAVIVSSVASILTGALFAGWVIAPVLDRIAVWQWNAIGGIMTALIAAGAARITRSRGRAVLAVAVGLFAGIIWLDWLPDDVNSVRPTVAGVLRLIGLFRWNLVLFIGSAWAGAILGGGLAMPDNPVQPTSSGHVAID